MTAGKRAPRRLHSRVAVVAGLVVFFVLAGTGVAAAAWQASTSVNSSVTAATTQMTLTTASGSLGTSYKFAGAATNSPIIVKGVTITNTGTAPLNYSLSVSNVGGNSLAPAVAVTLWTTTGTCGTTVGVGSTSGTLASLPAMPASAASAVAGPGFTLCIATWLTTTVAASQGLTITPTFTVTGTVGTSSWKSSAADAAFTQSVYQVPNPTGVITCAATAPTFWAPSGYVTLAWIAPTGLSLSYRIIDTLDNSVVTSGTGTTANISYNDLQGSPANLLVQTVDGVYGTTSPGLAVVLTRATARFWIWETATTSVSC